MLIGYMRVSKADGSQVLDLQRDALVGAGVEAEHLYEDHASGKRDNRPGLEACLKALRKDDTLVAWKLDRLGRDLRHLVNLVHDLTGRGVGLKVLAGQGANLDTTTANGRLVFGIFAALAEFERELIVERTRAGLASARARGRNGGRPFKMTPAKLRLAQAAMGQPGTKVGELCAPSWASPARRSTAMWTPRGSSGRTASACWPSGAPHPRDGPRRLKRLLPATRRSRVQPAVRSGNPVALLLRSSGHHRSRLLKPTPGHASLLSSSSVRKPLEVCLEPEAEGKIMVLYLLQRTKCVFQ